MTIKTAPWSLAVDAQGDFTLACDSGQKVVGGGNDNPTGDAVDFGSRPGSDGASWKAYEANIGTVPASGSVFAICLK